MVSWFVMGKMGGGMWGSLKGGGWVRAFAMRGMGRTVRGKGNQDRRIRAVNRQLNVRARVSRALRKDMTLLDKRKI
jgi:hypothetical protein